ncbi:hypothetical protein [Robiginitalea aurantiaca]|uniref:Pyrrolo-quinoline quinone n=1 Tax=Robiginitalea aurantiaca TaxID=3056915 RepID=A0ABT7WGX5_9FLAO|nr:hypothetical protein [Robiginitalea aurantiaca]MDM9632172.1 hypothetical protein [Robiginitalea aurantiaca]
MNLKIKNIGLLMMLMGTLLYSGCIEKNKNEKVAEGVEEQTSKVSHLLPPANPFLIANSSYPSVHSNPAQSDVTKWATWNENVDIKEENTQWLPWVTSIGTVHRPYPNGEEALFVSGTNKIGKIKITNGVFEWVDEVVVPGYEYEVPSEDAIRATVDEMIAGGTDESKYLPPYANHVKAIKQSSANIGNGIYTMMDNEGNYFCGFGTSIFKVSDKNPGDVNSEIEIVKAFDVKDGVTPEEAKQISRIFALGMTYDGYIAVAMPGIIAVLDRNLENMQYIILEGEAVDNGISIDDTGGIYCVTSKYMRKIVWDGKKISDKEEDGAWKSPYDYVPNPKALSRGSGNTPSLMGFGPDEDHLVFVADAGEDISAVAFWRDEIPEDFEQKEGTKSRRIADQIKLTIDVPATIEWSPHIYGNGVMMMASAWPDPVYDENGKLAIFETVLTAGITREPPTGVEKWSWDKETYSLKSDWTLQRGLQWALYPVSATSNTVTLTIAEEGNYSLQTVDWDTGKEISTTNLGNNPIFNTAGGLFIPIDENRIYITGVMGPVMIHKE